MNIFRIDAGAGYVGDRIDPALAVARELGLPRLRVAVVTGDNVLPWVRANDVALLDSPQRASDLGERLLSANAYLGADALLECAAQVCGGYIGDPGQFDVPGLHELGFPLAEVQADGGGGVTQAVREVIAAASALVPREAARSSVQMLEL